jgi:hypothetical protein
MVTTRLSAKKQENLAKDTPAEQTEDKKNDDANEPAPAPDQEEEEPNNSTIEKKLREKKPLPDVKFLLEHGDPDAPPPSFKETALFLTALFVAFVVSFIFWHFVFLKDAEPGMKKDWNQRPSGKEL